MYNKGNEGTMKSNEQQLKDRGYFTKNVTVIYSTKTNEELWILLTSKNAQQRSIAVYMLSKRNEIKSPEFVKTLIQMLQKERKLYTRLAISNAFEKGNDETALQLQPYLGKIGCNQHHHIGRTSKKKSYPLARDIVARIICNMKVSPSYLLQLFDLPVIQLREALDIVGWHLFYNDYDIKPFYQRLSVLMQQSSDDVVLWKCMTCCSALPYTYAKTLLEPYVIQEGSPFSLELNRSLSISKARSKT